MDFDIPAELAAYLGRARRLHRDGGQADRAARTTTSGSSIIGGRMRARIGIVAGCRTTSGRSCSAKAKRLADEAGHYRYPFPKEYGGKDGTNLGMAIIREHLATKGLGLHNDLQNEHSIVGNNVGLLLMIHYGTEEQKAEWVDDLAEGRRGFAFGITEPQHGSDATHMETHAVRDGDEWVINGEKTWNTGIHKAQYDLIFARTSGKPGDGEGITAFLTPTSDAGVRDRRVPVDVQHADRPCPCAVHGRPGAARGDLRW